MRILTRYILRAHIAPFFFSLSVLTALLLINTVARRFESLAGKGLEASVVFDVLVLSIPYTLALTFPMSVLVAVLYVFSQLAADNEIAALKASGVNLARLLAPLIVVSVLLAGIMVWFNDRVLPEANHQLRGLLVDIGRKSPTLKFTEQVINEIHTDEGFRARYFLQAARIESATNRLYDIVIYDLSEAESERTIYADSGRMAFDRGRTDLYLTLFDGWIHEQDRDDPERFFRLFFDRQVIRMAGVGDQLERTEGIESRGDREMSIAMLTSEVEERRTQLGEVRDEARQEVVSTVRRILRGPGGGDEAGITVDTRIDPHDRLDAHDGPDLGPFPRSADVVVRRLTGQLHSLAARARVLQQGVNQYRVEIHKKYAIPFACIVFVLIGAPLALRFPRGGVGMVIVSSLVIFSIYWMGLTGGEQLGDKGMISPMWGMWAVNVVFLALGIHAMWRVGREVGTARSGGWSDVFTGLRAIPGRWFARRRKGGG
ncbi:MAG TPA: LptF/LptG family permease [Longimicrobiales bacterium]